MDKQQNDYSSGKRMHAAPFSNKQFDPLKSEDDFTGFSLTHSTFSNCGFPEISFERAAITGSKFEKCKFDSCNLNNADFEFCEFFECEFKIAITEGASFVNPDCQL